MKRTSNNKDLSFEKVWQMFQETDRKFQETDKKLRELETKFFGLWGKLIESLVEGSLVRLFRERGIEVTGTSQRRYKIWEGKEYEIDIIVENGDVVIPVEVKTSLSVKDVDQFIEKLALFKKVFSEYKKRKVYGAIAFLQARRDTTMYAYRKGLFVIKATGDSATILNDAKFKPKAF